MTEPLRILHVISRLDGYGGARMLRALAPRHAAMGRRVNVVALAAEEWVVRELDNAGVLVNVLCSRWTVDPVAIARLNRWRRQNPADVIHAWDALAWMHAAVTGPRDRLLAAWTARDDRALPTSWSLTPRSRQIPPGLPSSVPSPCDRSAAFTELGLPPNARMIAVAGPLVRAKELDETIWCFELVRVLQPTARLVIFGDGPDRARLERYANLVSEPGCVHFAAFRADLARLLPHADVFWQLDPAQTTPYALLEAMAAGVPAVASDMPAHRVAITPDATGCLVGLRNRADIARTTDQLLSDATLAQNIGRAGAEAARAQWPLERSADACEALYQIAALPGWHAQGLPQGVVWR